MINNDKFFNDLNKIIKDNGIDNLLNLSDFIISKYILNSLNNLDVALRRSLIDKEEYDNCIKNNSIHLQKIEKIACCYCNKIIDKFNSVCRNESDLIDDQFIQCDKRLNLKLYFCSDECVKQYKKIK